MNRLSDYDTIGAGSGVITKDGCAVDLYARLPAGREPEVIHAALPPGATILELGAGAGRMTRPLLALGHRVTAVDESAEMLERIGPGAETVRSTIEDLDLSRRFDAVVLASQLVNTPDADQLLAFLRTCRRHLAPGGRVLIEQAVEAFFAGLVPSEIQQGPVTVAFRNIRHAAPDLVGMTIEYRLGRERWTQTLLCRRFDPAHLAAVGLRHDGALTEDGAWFAATAAPETGTGHLSRPIDG
ncbi:class I SAM-dependent methyltransferase [Kitasatospora sp. NPDC101235]|uniref:class I SAM-dependent methyltransferase n=1 Tax=Kitasatospora sp. NPDC101235 TaxID=3364101 RepID=UPI0037FDA541